MNVFGRVYTSTILKFFFNYPLSYTKKRKAKSVRTEAKHDSRNRKRTAAARQRKENKMADKLVQLYEEASKLGGLKAKMRMSILTRIPSNKAADVADDPETVKKFEDALAEIRKEYN